MAEGILGDFPSFWFGIWGRNRISCRLCDVTICRITQHAGIASVEIFAIVHHDILVSFSVALDKTFKQTNKQLHISQAFEANASSSGIYSKSEKVCGIAFSVKKKNCRKSA